MLPVLRKNQCQRRCGSPRRRFIGSRSIQLEQVPTSAARCVQLELLHRAATSARRMPTPSLPAVSNSPSTAGGRDVVSSVAGADPVAGLPPFQSDELLTDWAGKSLCYRDES